MMDLNLDDKQSKALQCSSCDPQKMKLRNCQNKWGKSQSPILVNGNVYLECPRSFVTDQWEVGYLVSLYYECRDSKRNPFDGSLMGMTAFNKDLFDYIDTIVFDYRDRENKKEEERQKKEIEKMKIESKRGR